MLYDNIKKICQGKGISISSLERELGFAKSYLYKWNTNIPSVDKVVKVADYLDVSIDRVVRDNNLDH